ncbi:FtsW/RodA/SpoVE family cell cycle protein [Peribacillus asahii]|nr:FtsW/RodA/SpoVE family cell cycle protein [Peribacillus asahii]USK86372.1 FtsW/RodA/SpoVE family cell cycle protein [Peribacillus asahii]
MKRIIKAYDYPIFIAIVLLCLFGLVMVYSSSMITAVGRYNYPMDYFYEKQKIALIISFVAMIAAMIFPYKAYQNKKFLMFIMFGIAGSLIVVDLFGHASSGAQSWIKIGSSSFQPAEFAKLAMIIYLAAMYGKRQDRINNIDKAVIPPILFLIGICYLIATQPDYGSAAIIFLISCTIIVSSGMTLKSLSKLLIIFVSLAGIFALGVLLTGNLSSVFSDNKVARFTGFMDPFGTAGDDGYQLVNSLLAIGSGGLTGVGLGDSVQKYGYLPEAHTDFILAIISEELGVFGVGFVLLTLGFIVLRGFILSAKCKDPFGSLLLIGISSMIGIQVFINVGGVTGLIPITGITLPFISYGGTSLLLMMISMGIFQNIIMRMNLLEEKENSTPKIIEEIHNSQ